MPQKFLSIKNLEKYQNYSKNSPPWIRIHRSILGDREFMKLSIKARYLYIGLIILATETNNRIYNDPTWIGQRLDIPHTEIDLKPLYRCGFLFTSNLSRSLSEERRGETETEERERGADAPPSPPVVHINGTGQSKKRPVPLPPDFKFSPELKEWALSKGCKEPFAEFERFTSKATSKGWTYVDWTKAYQNWVLNELKWAREKHHA